VLGTLGGLVLEFGESLCDIAGHRHVYGAVAQMPASYLSAATWLSLVGDGGGVDDGCCRALSRYPAAITARSVEDAVGMTTQVGSNAGLYRSGDNCTVAQDRLPPLSL
jgi:hypothetical protein